MAYVLGYFTADGNMIMHKNGGCYIEFSSNDYELIERTKKYLKSGHKITRRIRRHDLDPQYRIQIGSKDIFNDLLKLGLTPNKSKTIRLPKIPKEFFFDFVRGYFDGDGCAYLGKHWAKDRKKTRWIFNIRFSSGSLDFLHDLWKELKKHGISGGYVYDKNGRGYELVFSWLRGINLCKFMYDNISADKFLYRKFRVYQKALGII